MLLGQYHSFGKLLQWFLLSCHKNDFTADFTIQYQQSYDFLRVAFLNLCSNYENISTFFCLSEKCIVYFYLYFFNHIRKIYRDVMFMPKLSLCVCVCLFFILVIRKKLELGFLSNYSWSMFSDSLTQVGIE